jgi:hypothetical protein
MARRAHAKKTPIDNPLHDAPSFGLEGRDQNSA